MATHVKTIGLTGGIGSGKSTVAALLEECGATVIYADAVGHESYRPHTPGWRRIVETFGSQVLAHDATVDRKQLGALVFRDPQALSRLNAIVHPLIFAEVRRRLDDYRAAGHAQPVVFEAAVLIEANWLPLVDEVWLVVAGRDAVVQRLAKQRQLPPGDVEARIAAQIGDEERRRYAHVVVHNTGSLDELRDQVWALWARAAG